jgi:Leucine-rich repeat (LRR) protein
MTAARTSDQDDLEEDSKREHLGSSRGPAELSLQDCHLQTLSNEIVKLPLKVLILDGNELTELSSHVGELTDLQKLSVEKNKLRALPQSIGTLRALEYLNASHNSIRELPETFSWPQGLKFLYLSFNSLDTLPGPVQDLTLKELHIRHNPLKVDEKLRNIFLSLKANGCNINCDRAVGQQFTPPIVWEKTQRFFEDCP